MIYVVPNIPEPLSRAICAELIGSLPAPANDSPEQRALRDERAITALAHYLPENAAEAELAADPGLRSCKHQRQAGARSLCRAVRRAWLHDRDMSHAAPRKLYPEAPTHHRK